MYMVNMRNLHLGPNATYIPLTCVRGNANFKIRVGGNAYFSVFRYQHVGIANAKFRVGGLSQRKDQTQMFLRHSGIYRLICILYLWHDVLYFLNHLYGRSFHVNEYSSIKKKKKKKKYWNPTERNLIKAQSLISL